MKLNQFGRRAVFVSFVALSCLSVGCSVAPADAASDSTSEDVTSKKAHFETFTGLDGQSYFALLAANGQKVLRSEGYASDEGAKNGIITVIRNGVDKASFTVAQATNGEWYFDLRAENGEIVGTSELYASKSNATRGVTAVTNAVMSLGSAPKTSAAPKNERFEVFTGADGETYFHLRASNGEIVLSSQGYTKKASALSGIASVETNGVNVASFEVFAAHDGLYAFDLKAANGQIIARGETYASKSNANRAVARIAEILSAPVTIKQ